MWWLRIGGSVLWCGSWDRVDLLISFPSRARLESGEDRCGAPPGLGPPGLRLPCREHSEQGLVSKQIRGAKCTLLVYCTWHIQCVWEKKKRKKESPSKLSALKT
jgi:hypothetical protein